MNNEFLSFIRFQVQILLLAVSITTNAEIKLPAIFGSHMVLQQQTEVAVWGNAVPDQTVRVLTSWDGKSYKVQSDAVGTWKLRISTPTAGGPYTISISDGKSIVLEDILIGEVWICAGQSNMQMPMSGYYNEPVMGANKDIASSTNKSIRLFTVEHNKSIEPLENFAGKWNECIPENVVDFSAAAYYFGRMLHEQLNVPVGLVCSSWGGTRIEPWISEQGIKQFDFVSLPEKKEKTNIANLSHRNTPTILYNAMINPIIGFAMRGCLWYQGESNRLEPGYYGELMKGLINDWRDNWGIGDFPFYYAQIAPHNYGSSGLNSSFLREAQLNVSTELPNIGMVCLMDVGEEYGLHPSNKRVVGERFAYCALAETYKVKGIACSGPVLNKMTIEGNLVKLTFDNATHGLTSFGKALVNFEVSGEDKRFFSAAAVITKKGVSLSSSFVAKPVAVRYAFNDFTVGDFFNTEGLPVSSFRTDDWDK